MPHPCFQVDVVDRVAHIVMCRPEKRNSMVAAFWEELPAIVERLEDALDYVALWNASMLNLEEIGEAMAANAERRAGRFLDLPPLPGSRKR